MLNDRVIWEAEKRDKFLVDLEKIWQHTTGEDIIFREALRIAIIRRRELIKQKVQDENKDEKIL